jgi:glycosyltransferase involved in cell wall biosynthesis
LHLTKQLDAPSMSTQSRSTAAPAFVVFGDDWGRHVSTMQHLFSRVARERTVIWINSLGNREPGWGDLGRAIKKLQSMLRRGSVRATPTSADKPAAPQVIIEPRVLPWHLNRIASAFNRASLKRDISAAVRRTAIDNFVLVTGLPPSAPVVGECGERASIYFCMDDFLVLPGTSPRMMAVLEEDLLRRADAVVATAQRLVEVKTTPSGRGYHLPQGVNYVHFATPQPVPPELAVLPRPLIGFAGGVGPAVDIETVRRICEAVPHGSVVMIGPVTIARQSLTASNLHLLGPRAYANLPAYVQSFDVGLIPYIESDWTRAVDPLKLLEYLAAGVPVVATPLPEVLKYSEAVVTAPLGQPFVDAVLRTLAGSDGLRAKEAQAFASKHSWEHRAARFLEIVDEVCSAALASRAH